MDEALKLSLKVFVILHRSMLSALVNMDEANKMLKSYEDAINNPFINQQNLHEKANINDNFSNK